jgi:hypothetical protein
MHCVLPITSRFPKLMHPPFSPFYELQAKVTIHQKKIVPVIISPVYHATFHITYTSGIQPGVREDTLRLSFLSFKTYYLIHYFGCNLFYLF